jgi:hypothetical protein
VWKKKLAGKAYQPIELICIRHDRRQKLDDECGGLAAIYGNDRFFFQDARLVFTRSRPMAWQNLRRRQTAITDRRHREKNDHE